MAIMPSLPCAIGPVHVDWNRTSRAVMLTFPRDADIERLLRDGFGGRYAKAGGGWRVPAACLGELVDALVDLLRLRELGREHREAWDGGAGPFAGPVVTRATRACIAAGAGFIDAAELADARAAIAAFGGEPVEAAGGLAGAAFPHMVDLAAVRAAFAAARRAAEWRAAERDSIPAPVRCGRSPEHPPAAPLSVDAGSRVGPAAQRRGPADPAKPSPGGQPGSPASRPRTWPHSSVPAGSRPRTSPMGTGGKVRARPAGEFLAVDQWAVGDARRYEPVDGRIIARAAPAPAHGAIVAGLVAALGVRLGGRAQRCWPEVGSGAAPVSLQQHTARFPDAVVRCGGSPRVVFVVVSASEVRAWRGHDRMRADLQSAEGVSEIVEISQDEVAAHVYRKAVDGSWSFEAIGGPDAVLRLPSVGIELPFAEVYAFAAVRGPPKDGGGGA